MQRGSALLAVAQGHDPNGPWMTSRTANSAARRKSLDGWGVREVGVGQLPHNVDQKAEYADVRWGAGEREGMNRIAALKGADRRSWVVLALGLAGLIFAILGPAAAQAQAACASGWTDDGGGLCELDVEYSGASATVTVPVGVHVVTILAGGAAEGGDTSGDAQQDYGFGGFAQGDLSVTPGETLIAVAGGQGQTGSNGTGGAGGYGGGGSGGNCHTSNPQQYCGPPSGGNGGGGGSFVWANGSLVLVAGGAGADSGGDGGGQTGDTGCCLSPDPNIYGGKGGTQSGGGATGYCDECGANSAPGGTGGGPAGGPGSFGKGGDGGTYPSCTASACAGGGGGGGGYYGGGGGTALTGTLGGGGGSSYLSPMLANAYTTKGAGAGYGRRRNNGHVTFEYTQPSTQISGTITTPPAGDGWANATVKLTGTDATTHQTVSDTATTDSSGSYAFALNPGTYTVEPVVPAKYLPAGADLYTPTQCGGTAVKDTCASIALAADQSATANFTAAYTITGTVTGLDGKGVAGATVHFVDAAQNVSRSLTATTNAQGQMVSSPGAPTVGVQLAPGTVLAYVDSLNGTMFFPVPSEANDPDCVPAGDRCQVNLNHDRDIGFSACVVPNPDGSPLPPPFDTQPSVPIPGAITAGNLEAVGCWKPTDSSSFDTATQFSSDQPVRLDGLDLLPAAGVLGEPSTTFALNKLARTVTVQGAPAVLQIGGIAIWDYAPGSVLDFSGAAFAVEDLGLGESYGGLVGPQIAGLPLAVSTGGSFHTLFPPWSFSPGQTSLTINPVVPTVNQATSWDWQKGEFQGPQGKVPNVGPQLTFTTTNREGFLLSNTNLCATLGDKSLNPWQWDTTPEEDRLTINGITACLNPHTLVWSLSGLFEVDVPGAPDRVSVAVTLHKFDLMKFSTLADGFNEEMVPGVFFQRVGVAATWDVTKSPPVASSIELNGGISFGPQLTDEGPFKLIVQRFPALDGAELMSMDASGAVTLSNPLKFTLKGTIYAFRRTTIQMVFGSGFIDWWPITNQFNFGGDLTDWPIVPLVAHLTANLSGWLALDQTHAFQLQAHGSLIPTIGQPLPADVLVNNNVVAACSTAFGTGYVRYWATGASSRFPAGNCGLGQYALPNPTPGAAGDQARGASTGARSIRIPRGLASTVLAIRGKTAPLVVTLRGPRGQSVTTPATGSLHTAGFWVSVDRSTDTTYVAIAHPAAGIWTIRSRPGSSPIAQVLEANPAPKPRISAKVSLAGCTERLSYTYHPTAGDQVTLYAQNGAQRTFFGRARAGTLMLRFVPALTGAGQIVAITSHNGIPSAETALAGFNPAGYRQAATPRHLHVQRGVLSWTAACNARGYTVTTAYGQTTTTQTTTTQTTRASHVALPKIRGAYTVTVAASIAGGGVTTASAHFR